MDTSDYFESIAEEYYNDIESLAADSQGANVLKKRLAEVRAALPGMVGWINDQFGIPVAAQAFHGAFRFRDPAEGRRLLRLEPGDLPGWEGAVTLLVVEKWAEPMIELVKRNRNWQQFLVIAACLDHYYWGKNGLTYKEPAIERQDCDVSSGVDGDTEVPDDLGGEAGAKWLEDQGFDSLNDGTNDN